MQLVQFQVVPVANHAALADGERRIVHNGRCQRVPDFLVQLDGGRQFLQQSRPRFLKAFLQRGQRVQRRAQAHQIAGIGAAHFEARQDALQIEHFLQVFLDGVPQFGIARQLFHRILPFADLDDVQDGALNPVAQAARTHGCGREIEYVEQRPLLPAVPHVPDQLQIADGRGIEVHVLFRRYPLQPVDLGQVRHDRGVQVGQEPLHRFPYQRIQRDVPEMLLHKIRRSSRQFIGSAGTARQLVLQPVFQVTPFGDARLVDDFRRLQAEELLFQGQEPLAAVRREPTALAGGHVGQSQAQDAVVFFQMDEEAVPRVFQ